jgi:hypothetical protein
MRLKFSFLYVCPEVCIYHISVYIICSKTVLEKSPKFRLTELYNKLPESIKSIDSLNKFKKEVFNYLKNLNIYSVKEFV